MKKSEKKRTKKKVTSWLEGILRDLNGFSILELLDEAQQFCFSALLQIQLQVNYFLAAFIKAICCHSFLHKFEFLLNKLL